MKAYVDTSVLVACYCPERLSSRSEKAVRRLAGPSVSPFVEVEFSSAVAIKVRTGELAKPDGQRIVSLFRSHVGEGKFLVLPVEARHFALAREWISRFDSPLRAMDALHLAVAFTNSMPILTADAVQSRIARNLGLESRLIG